MGRQWCRRSTKGVVCLNLCGAGGMPESGSISKMPNVIEMYAGTHCTFIGGMPKGGSRSKMQLAIEMCAGRHCSFMCSGKTSIETIVCFGMPRMVVSTAELRKSNETYGKVSVVDRSYSYKVRMLIVRRTDMRLTVSYSRTE